MCIRDSSYSYCNGHGKCFADDNGESVSCECDFGYAGPSCALLCPEFDPALGENQQLCNGKGDCLYNASSEESYCKCSAGSQAYGLACEYRANALPLRGCSQCDGDNEVCLDQVCGCEHPYYRVGPHCVAASHASARVSRAHIVAVMIACVVAFLSSV